LKKFYFFLAILLAVLMPAGCGKKLPEMNLDDLDRVWGDFEKATYDFSVDGEKLTEAIFTIKKDGDYYRVGQRLEIDGGVNDTGAVVGKNLEPLSAHYQNLPPATAEAPAVEIQGRYAEGKLELQAHVGEKEQNVNITLSGKVLDNESVLMAIRNFPLAEGYSKEIKIAIIASAQVAPYTIKVEDLETVRVPYGELECYKVVMTYTGPGEVPDMYAWYSNDDKRILVKYQNQNVLFALKAWEGD